MYRKSGCIFKKTQFLQGKTETLQRERAFLQKRIVLCTEKSACIVKKTQFLQGKTETLHRKRGFL